MRFYAVILLFSAFVFSCSKKSVEGLYQRKFETIDLKSNFTFSYVYRIEWVKKKSEGRWKNVGKNEVVISSQYDVDSLPVKVIERDGNIEGESIFKMIPEGIDSSLRKGLQYELFLNGQSYGRQKQGEIKVRKPSDLASVKIRIYVDKNILPFPPRDSVSTETYRVQSTQSNSFEVHLTLNADMFYYENISNDTLKVKGKKLYWASKGNPPYKKNN